MHLLERDGEVDRGAGLLGQVREPEVTSGGHFRKTGMPVEEGKVRVDFGEEGREEFRLPAVERGSLAAHDRAERVGAQELEGVLKIFRHVGVAFRAVPQQRQAAEALDFGKVRRSLEIELPRLLAHFDHAHDEEREEIDGLVFPEPGIGGAFVALADDEHFSQEAGAGAAFADAAELIQRVVVIAGLFSRLRERSQPIHLAEALPVARGEVVKLPLGVEHDHRAGIATEVLDDLGGALALPGGCNREQVSRIARNQGKAGAFAPVHELAEIEAASGCNRGADQTRSIATQPRLLSCSRVRLFSISAPAAASMCCCPRAASAPRAKLTAST